MNIKNGKTFIEEGNRCNRLLLTDSLPVFFKTSLSFPKKYMHIPHLEQVIKYSVYICKLSTVRATFQQNEHCFAKT